MTTIHLHQKPRKKTFLIISLISLFFNFIFINVFPPTNFFLILIFFILIGFFIFYLLLFIFKSPRRSLLITLGIILIFILRAIDLKHWLYPSLIIAINTIIEIYFYNKDKS
jgi:hypothetical protein